MTFYIVSFAGGITCIQFFVASNFMCAKYPIVFQNTVHALLLLMAINPSAEYIFVPNLIAIFKIKFCFTFVSDHMLYSVQLKNVNSYLNSSLKLSDIVRGHSCQQSFCKLSLYKLMIIIPFILYIFTFFQPHHVTFNTV